MCVYPCPVTWANTNELLGSTVSVSVQTTMMVRVSQIPHKEAVVAPVSPPPTRQLANDMLIITPQGRAKATREAHAEGTGKKPAVGSTGGSSGKLLSSAMPLFVFFNQLATQWVP